MAEDRLEELDISPALFRAAAQAVELCELKGWTSWSDGLRSPEQRERVAEQLNLLAEALEQGESLEEMMRRVSGLRYSPEGQEVLRVMARFRESLREASVGLGIAHEKLMKARDLLR